MQHQNQDESGEKNTAVRLNKEIVLPTTAKRNRIISGPCLFTYDDDIRIPFPEVGMDD